MKKEDWVDTVLEEARQHGQHPVRVDLASLEAKLMARIDADERPRLPQVPASRVPRWKVASSGVMAMAALAALWSLVWHPTAAVDPVAPVASGPTAPVSPATGRRWLDQSGERPALEKAGLASLWLEPGGKGWADDSDGRLRFELSEGAVSLEVVPQRQPDRVEVVAGNVRVVVKGTRFRVARQGDRVDVDVDHGVVQVSRVDDPSSATLLTGPAGGSFGPDAPAGMRPARTFVAGVAPADSGAVPAGSVASAPSTRPTEVAAPSSKVPLRAGDLPGRAYGLVSRCLSSSSTASPGVVVTIATTLAVDVDAQGRATSASFSPPLSPAVEQCTRRSLGRLGGTPGHHEVPLSLSLGGH